MFTEQKQSHEKESIVHLRKLKRCVNARNSGLHISFNCRNFLLKDRCSKKATKDDISMKRRPFSEILSSHYFEQDKHNVPYPISGQAAS